MFKKVLFLELFLVTVTGILQAQDINQLLADAKAKISKVKDYEASGKMKTNVTFLKVPVANVKVYFKAPSRMKIKSEKGVSFIPKGAVSINAGAALGDNRYTIIDAGMDKVGNTPVRVAKLLPGDESSDVVLSTVYVDPVTNLLLKSRTTTKENGTFELEMTYGKYAEYALPDKVIFSFNTKDYKLPKGVTFDFDDGSKAPRSNQEKQKKGRAEITFSKYIINNGVSDDLFR